MAVVVVPAAVAVSVAVVVVVAVALSGHRAPIGRAGAATTGWPKGTRSTPEDEAAVKMGSVAAGKWQNTRGTASAERLAELRAMHLAGMLVAECNRILDRRITSRTRPARTLGRPTRRQG